MDTLEKKQYLIHKLSDTENLFQMREACQEFLAATASDLLLYRKPQNAAELFQAIVSGLCHTEKEIKALAASCIGDTDGQYVIIVADKQQEHPVVPYAHHIDALAELGRCWSFVHQDSLVCVVSYCDIDIYAYPAVKYLVEQKFRAGISQPIADISDMPFYYDQARLTLKFAKVLERGTPICTADNFYMLRLLLGIKSGANIMDFCLDEVLRLTRYDQDNHTELCETLLTFLVNSKSTSVTAKLMNLHRNTILYRIDQCREILGHDFDDGVITFMTIISLHIMELKRYQEKLNHEPERRL